MIDEPNEHVAGDSFVNEVNAPVQFADAHRSSIAKSRPIQFEHEDDSASTSDATIARKPSSDSESTATVVPVISAEFKQLLVKPDVVQTTEKAANARTRTWAFEVFMFFASWSVVGGMRLLIQRIRLKRATHVLDEPTLRILDRLRDTYRIRRDVRLFVSESFTEPAVVGIFRWTLLLPTGIEKQLDKEQMRALLSHELAHFVRGDTRWLWIGRLLTNCLGWQPLNLIAVRQWRAASEFLCDDWALDRGISSLSLAKCLSQVAEWRVDGPALVTGLPAGGTRHSLVSLVERLTQNCREREDWDHRAFRVLFLFCVVVVVSLTAYAAPRASWNSGDRGNSASENTHEEIIDMSEHDQDIAASLDLGSTETAVEHNDHELLELSRDLERAMTLLQELEDDPEIDQMINQIRARVNQIRQRAR